MSAYQGAIVGEYIYSPSDRSTSYAALRSIWVEPELRGEGIAHSLVARFEIEAKLLGTEFVDIHVDICNNLAIKLWDKEDYLVYQERRKKAFT